MRRADRPFEIVHHLRGRRLTAAAQLAQWLEISERSFEDYMRRMREG